MKSQSIQESSEKTRTRTLIFDTGDSVVSPLTDFAKEHDIKSAHFTAIGAFKEATLFYYNWEKKEYQDIPVDEQTEVLSLIGNIAHKGDKIKIHTHVALGRRDGNVIGGHLKEGTVRPTLELFLTEGSEKLERKKDETTGLALINL